MGAKLQLGIMNIAAGFFLVPKLNLGTQLIAKLGFVNEIHMLVSATSNHFAQAKLGASWRSQVQLGNEKKKALVARLSGLCRRRLKPAATGRWWAEPTLVS